MKKILLACLLAVAVQARADCLDGRVEVAAGAPEQTERVCGIAEALAPRLASCGLAVEFPLVVDVLERMPEDVADCLGVFRCDERRIEILSPGAMASKTEKHALYDGMDEQTLFSAVLTHELTHAAVEDTLAGRDITRTGHEYIAYAMLIAGLPDAARDRIMSSSDLPSSIPVSYFNPFILDVRPDRFAVLAYAHFLQDQHGCAFVSKILSGEVILGNLPF